MIQGTVLAEKVWWDCAARCWLYVYHAMVAYSLLNLQAATPDVVAYCVAELHDFYSRWEIRDYGVTVRKNTPTAATLGYRGNKATLLILDDMSEEYDAKPPHNNTDESVAILHQQCGAIAPEVAAAG